MKKRDWEISAVELVPINLIEVGNRRRERFRGIAKFAKELEEDSLLNPIVITVDNVLVAGGRRLAAFKKLGRRKIPARRLENMTHEELRRLEIRENTSRDDLSDFELSKKMVEEAEAEKPSEPRTVSIGGRGQKSGTREQARRAGVPKSTLHDAKKHVAAAEEVPAFKGDDWTKGQVIHAKKKLDALPDSTRAVAIDMISEPGIPAKIGVAMIETLSEKPKKVRAEIERLYRSEDEERRELAKTKAAKRPPPAPHRLTWLREAIRLVERVQNDSLLDAPDDLAAARAELRSALKISEQSYKRQRRAEGF